MPNRAQYLVGWLDQRCAWGIGPSDDYVEGEEEEERMSEEREMQWATRMIGRSLLQPGRIIVN